MNEEQLELFEAPVEALEETLVEEPKELGRGPGFCDPEVRKRAMESSLAKRRGLLPAKPGDFIPSKNMLLILRIALDLESGDSVRGWFAKAGLNRGTWFVWQENPAFKAWWKKEFAEGLKEYETKWLLIGLRKMSKDFRYWNEIGKKVYHFIDTIAIKEEKSPEEAALYTELLGLIQSYKGVKTIENAQNRQAVDVDYTVEDLEASLEGEKK
jgi:hypothetical protein